MASKEVEAVKIQKLGKQSSKGKQHPGSKQNPNSEIGVRPRDTKQRVQNHWENAGTLDTQRQTGC